MSRTALLASCVFVVAGLSGCASPAKIIDSTSNSVVIAIPENTNTWPYYYQDEAKKAAIEKLQDPILMSTKRVKVGEQVTETQDVRRASGTSEVVTNSTASSSDKYEYRLAYQKRDAGQIPNSIRPMTPSAPVPTGPLDPQMRPADYKAPVIPSAANDVHMPLNPPSSPTTTIPSMTLPAPGQGR